MKKTIIVRRDGFDYDRLRALRNRGATKIVMSPKNFACLMKSPQASLLDVDWLSYSQASPENGIVVGLIFGVWLEIRSPLLI